MMNRTAGSYDEMRRVNQHPAFMGGTLGGGAARSNMFQTLQGASKPTPILPPQSSNRGSGLFGRIQAETEWLYQQSISQQYQQQKQRQQQQQQQRTQQFQQGSFAVPQPYQQQSAYTSQYSQYPAQQSYATPQQPIFYGSLDVETGVKTPKLFWLKIKRSYDPTLQFFNTNGGFNLFDQALLSHGVKSHTPLQKVFRQLAAGKGYPRPKLDSKEDRWEFPIPIHDSVMDYLRTHPNKGVVELSVKPIQPKLLARMEAIRLNAQDNKGHPSCGDLVALGVPRLISKSMAPFQRSSVRFSSNKGGVAFIADEMGLGKTLQSIAVMSKYTEDWPVLVVCPSAARFHWQSEFVRWLGVEAMKDESWEMEEHIEEDEEVEEVVEIPDKISEREGGKKASSSEEDDDDSWNISAKRTKGTNPKTNNDSNKKGKANGRSVGGSSNSKGASKPRTKQAKSKQKTFFPLHLSDIHVIMSGDDRFTHRHKVVIASYGLFSNLVKNNYIKPSQFKCVIVDESHMMKSLTAKRTKALMPICTSAKRRILLSGTPALSKPLELFTQIRCVSKRDDDDLKNGPEDEHSEDPFINYTRFKKRYCARDTGSHKEELFSR